MIILVPEVLLVMLDNVLAGISGDAPPNVELRMKQ